MFLSGRLFARFPHRSVLGHLIREHLGEFHLQIGLEPFVGVDFALDLLVFGEGLLHTVLRIQLRVSALVDVAGKRYLYVDTIEADNYSVGETYSNSYH